MNALVPDAPDAHDLPSGVDEPEALEQVTAIAEQRPPVLADHEPRGLDRLLAGEELRDRDDQRRVADDPRLAVDDARELLERGQAVLRAGLRNVPLRALDRLPAHLRGPAREDVLDVDARVPEIHRPHRGECGHRLAVGAADPEVDRLPPALVEAAIPAGHREAGDEPLDIPLERPRQRLVEVVRVEHEPPVRGRVHPEVREVRVAAQLHVQPRPRHAREIRGHDVRRPAIERERRDQHPPVPDRHELLHPRLRLLLEQLDRVGANRRRLPRGVGPRGTSARAALPLATRSATVKCATGSSGALVALLPLGSPGIRLRRTHWLSPAA